MWTRDPVQLPSVTMRMVGIRHVFMHVPQRLMLMQVTVFP